MDSNNGDGMKCDTGAASIDVEDVACLGCGRSRVHGREWLRPDTLVAWGGPGRKGLWCKDCHTCWRTYWSPSHSLALFGRWLSLEANFGQWEISLVAFLSLVVEGVDEVTMTLIDQRMRTLRWLAEFMGWSVRPSVVMPLIVAFTQVNREDIATALMCTCVDATRSAYVGVMVPATSVKLDGAFPRPPARTPMLNSRVMLCTSNNHDVNRLKGDFGLVGNATAASTIKDEVDVASSPESKLLLRCQSLCGGYTRLLENFQTATWKVIKESSLTTPVSKMAAIAAEGSATGERQVTQMATKWSTGMTACKQLLKLYRELVKTNFEDDLRKGRRGASDRNR